MQRPFNHGDCRNPRHMSRHLIVTADDFGLHESVNEAVEQAARAGTVTAASLMVSGAAAADAICRARRLPHLRIGLHVVLADGYATLPPEEIPQLVDHEGFLSAEMLKRSIQLVLAPRVRRQIEAELHAQFRAFERTGLALDHVNVHKHFHFHPLILAMLIRVGREYGTRAIRLPREPLWFARQRGHSLAGINTLLMRPLIAQMKQQLRLANIRHNDHLFGIASSGAMNEECLLAILRRLPPGVSEIYTHPAVLSGPQIASSMRTYRHAEELSGLLSSKVRRLLGDLQIRRSGFGDAFPP